MWSTIPTPWRAPVSAARSSSSTSSRCSPSSETGRPRSNPIVTSWGSSGASSGRVTSWKTSSGGRLVEVLDRPALRRAAPEVVVDRVGRDLGPALHRDPVLARVVDLLLAAHLPLAHRREDPQLGIERRDRRLDPDLVVALAGAAVGDRVAAVLARRLDGELADQRPAERREQRVAAAVEGVRLDRGQHVVVGELLARVDQHGLDRAELLRLAGDHLPVLAGLAEVDGERDDLGAVALLDPLQHHAGVEAAGVEQQHAAHLGGVGLVGGDSRRLGVPAIEAEVWRVRSAAAARIPAVHRATRIVSTMLITAGIVVLADAGLTLVWQEPLSAAYGALKQSEADDQLKELEAQYPSPGRLAAIAGVQGNAAKARILADRFAPHLRGPAIGRIKIDRIGLDIVVVQGTDTTALQQGPGHYRATRPGTAGTVAIAGHRTTYLAPFRHIDEIQDGDEVRIEMPYAAFTYTVHKHEIVDPSDVGILKPVGFDQLVMTACDPPYSAAHRYASSRSSPGSTSST